jgi:hypothetical protein
MPPHHFTHVTSKAMDRATAQRYADEWCVVQWQTPAVPNRGFYTKWALFIESMTGIKGLEGMCDMERFSVGCTVALMLQQRAGITGKGVTL